jgi:hypothetical protein
MKASAFITAAALAAMAAGCATTSQRDLATLQGNWIGNEVRPAQEIQRKCTLITRMGMYLMGQAVFSNAKMKRFNKPRSIKSIALCIKDDVVLRPMLEKFRDVEVDDMNVK